MPNLDDAAGTQTLTVTEAIAPLLQWQGAGRTFCAGEFILRQHTPGGEMFVVYCGRVDILLEGPGQQDIRLESLGPGDFFGEMSLVDGRPRSASAVAAEDDTQVLVLNQGKLVELIRQQPETCLLMLQTICRRIRAMNQRMSGLQATA